MPRQALRWLLAGKREASWGFPRAGVGTDEPLAEWEKELLVRSDDTPAEPAAAPAPAAE